jgi:hypothetical protein
MNKVYISQEQAELIHSDEEILAHYGVKGMRWGVRKERVYSNNILRKMQVRQQIVEKAWQDATKGMSKAKAYGIYFFLGKNLGAKAINSAKARREDPKKAIKKETKILRKRISEDFARKSEAVFKAHEAQFTKQYGKNSGLKNAFTKSGRAKNAKYVDAYTNSLSKRMEGLLNNIANGHLAGSNYQISNVKGFNDFLPSFEITQVGSDLEHAATPRGPQRSWKLEFVKDSGGSIIGLKISDDFVNIPDEEFSFMDGD